LLRYCDFCDFEDGGRRNHLGFSKIRNFDGISPVGGICVTMPNFSRIGQTVAEIWLFNCFQNGGRPPSWIFEIAEKSRFCDFQDGGRWRLGFKKN